MSSYSFIEPDKVKQAILHATINLAGVALVAVVWLNYILLKPYIRPLFWATILSVPLHAIKNEILAYINDSVDNHEISLPHVFWLCAKLCARLCFGPLYTVADYVGSAYFTLVLRVSTVDKPPVSTNDKPPTNVADSPPRPMSLAWAQSNVVDPISSLFDHHYPWIKHLRSPDLRRRNSDQFLARTSSLSPPPHGKSSALSNTTRIKTHLPLLSHFPHHHSADSFLSDTTVITDDPSSISMSHNDEKSFHTPSSLSSSYQSAAEPSTSLSLPVLHHASRTAGISDSHPELHATGLRRAIGARTPRLNLSRDVSPMRKGIIDISKPPLELDDVAAAIDSSRWYLSSVWRASCVYFIVLVWRALGPVRQSAIGVLVGALVATHFIFHLLRRLFLIYFGVWAKQRFRPMDLWLGRVWDFLSPIARMISSGWGWLRKTYTSSRHNAKQAFVRNANSFSASFVLISILSLAIFLSGFLIFKVGQESAMLVESVVSTVETNLSDDMRAKFQNVIRDTSDMTIGWMDSKVQEHFPHLNVTALYRHLSRTFQGSSADMNTTAVVSAAASGGISDTDATQMFAGELARLTKLPHTAQVIGAFLAGDFLLEGSIILGMVDELRNIFTKGIDVGAASGYLSSLFGSLVSVSLAVMVGLLRVTLDFFDITFQVTIFLITLHALLSRETAITTWFAQLLILADPDMVLTRSLEDNLISVVWCTTKLTAFHSLLTWLTFSTFGVDLVYLSTVATAVLTVVPFFPPVWIAVLASISLYWRHARAWSAVVLLSIHVWATWFLDSAFYAQIPEVNSYFSALAVILGLWAFGLEGLVLGPLLLSVVPSVFSVVSQQIQRHQADNDTKLGGPSSSPRILVTCRDEEEDQIDVMKKNI